MLTILIASSCGTGSEKAESTTDHQQTKDEVRTPEARSLFGDDLYARELSDTTQKKFESNLKMAKDNYDSDPNDELNIIWYGRRLAYLGRYQDAIEVFTEGIEKHPDSYKLHRHRGHRYISTREFDKAFADLDRAVQLSIGTEPQLEPDGLPNKINTPLSTTQWNIQYHFGLAQYLISDLENASLAFEECVSQSDNPDILVASSDWLYMIYRRQGEEEKAMALLEAINSDMEIIENDSYHKRLLMYKGELTPEDLLTVSAGNDDRSLALATQGYGVGNWYLYNGDTTQAKEIFQEILNGDYWSAFGYIAAEADMYMLSK